jgi:hypothetical protein
MWALMAAAPVVFCNDGAGMRRALEAASSAGEVLLPQSAEGGPGDLEASLWFVRAGHVYGKNAEADRDFVQGVLLPRGKRIVQGVISGIDEAGTVRMDDGGMLVSAGNGALRLNALWYAALEAVAEGLHTAGDRAGDHFERLAGRFRRSFAKAYWCEAHGCVCVPGTREEGHGALPLADQVLLSVLPSSPIPRTKQRQALLRVKEAGLGRVGVKVEHGGEVVESVLHRVWLARALASTAENGAQGKMEAAEILGGLREKVGAEAAAFYKDGNALGGPDLLATAEVRAGGV